MRAMKRIVILISGRGSNMEAIARDAAITLAAAIGITLAVHQIELLLIGRFHAYALLDFGAPGLIVNKVPVLAAVTGALGLNRVYLGQALWWLPLGVTLGALPLLIGVAAPR